MTSQSRQHWFRWLAAAYVLYALAFIYKSSVVVEGLRYFLLDDDAMISMTYARNFAHGHGAVWYPGTDPVQGYSNPLWMLYMAAIHLLPLSARWMSLPVQLTGALFNLVTLVFVKRIAEQLSADDAQMVRHDFPDDSNGELSPPLPPFFAVLLTAFYLPLNEWSLRGMEVGVLACGITFAVYAALRCAAGKDYERWLFPLLGLLTTIRMDALVPGVVILLWLFWTIPQSRRRTFVHGTGWLALFIGAQLLFQKAYYHDWLPNTYYLKLDGIPLTRRVPWGLYVLLRFVLGFGIWLLIPLAIYVWRRPTRSLWLLVGVIAGQACYSVYVGGDAWEWWGGANRYLCVAIPLLFVLIACSMNYVTIVVSSKRGASFRRLAVAAAIVLGIVTLIQTNTYQFTPYNSLKICALLEEPHELDGHKTMLELALVVNRSTTPQARIAVTWAGILPYFSGRECIDLLGKNDRKVAHGPNAPETPLLDFLRDAPVPYCWPGHTKHDFPYSVGELKPDLVQLWYNMDEIRDLFQQEYIPVHIGTENLCLKKNSDAVATRSNAN